VIVQDFARGGNLLRYTYARGGRLSEPHAVRCAVAPLLSALRYLHALVPARK
jgi:hypothetical protein